eukprot:364529-Chlamydomonas_euryale.AAC.2
MHLCCRATSRSVLRGARGRTTERVTRRGRSETLQGVFRVSSWVRIETPFREWCGARATGETEGGKKHGKDQRETSTHMHWKHFCAPLMPKDATLTLARRLMT